MGLIDIFHSSAPSREFVEGIGRIKDLESDNNRLRLKVFILEREALAREAFTSQLMADCAQLERVVRHLKYDGRTRSFYIEDDLATLVNVKKFIESRINGQDPCQVKT